MKTFTSVLLQHLRHRAGRRNLMLLVRFLLVLAGLVLFNASVFHYLMALEDRQFTWPTSIYWALVTMSTLGYGDITFQSELGRMFSLFVLLSGTLFLLVLFPFIFIQFFYAPWMEAQVAARAPRQLPKETQGHVLMTNHEAVDLALIRRLQQHQIDYYILVPELDKALRLHDEGLAVMVGELDNPDSYRLACAKQAVLVVATQGDIVNTNVVFTAREVSPEVPIVATANAVASVDILELAGATRILQLGDMMGQAVARRVVGRDAKTHVIGEFGELLIAEAAAAHTPLIGRTLRDIRLREHVNLSVIGVWERGKFEPAGPETLITAHTVLVLAGTRNQLDTYDGLFCIYSEWPQPVVIIGGGRVGRSAGRALSALDVDYRIVERLPERVRDPEKYVLGEAADLQVLQQAGIAKAPAVAVTSHDDDMNVYLTIYCRRLRPDIQIIARSTLERNISTLHRAGADFVLSYASMGANTIFNLLRRSDILMLAEGLDVFKVKVPPSLAGKTLLDTHIRQQTGCSVIALITDDTMHVNPDPDWPLPPNAEIILIGSAEAENQFLDRYGKER